MKQKSWISIVFSFASQCRGKIALSVLCAIISVVAGLIPYWSVYQIITLFIGGFSVLAEGWEWGWIGVCAYAVSFFLFCSLKRLFPQIPYTHFENIWFLLSHRAGEKPPG